jgi:hypothetical protein
MSEYGPATTLLAALTERDVDAVATQPAETLRAVADLARSMARLAADRASDDAAVRAAARRRTDEVAALVRAVEAEHPTAAGERLRTRIEAALTKVLRDLEASSPSSPS